MLRRPLALLFLLCLSACAQRGPTLLPMPRDRGLAGGVDASLEAVLDEARALLGQRRVVVQGRRFQDDCSGFVRGVFSVLGVDLLAGVPGEAGENGVRLIRRHLELNGRLHDGPVPSPGDIAFFDDTWDRNGNGRRDDPLTHVGVVERVDPDGTFHVIHLASRGVVRDAVNRLRPDDRHDGSGRVINAWLRKEEGGLSEGERLAGGLLAGFGSLRRE